MEVKDRVSAEVIMRNAIDCNAKKAVSIVLFVDNVNTRTIKFSSERSRIIYSTFIQGLKKSRSKSSITGQPDWGSGFIIQCAKF